jgi:hypothetical protein
MSGMQATRLKWTAKVLAIGLGVLVPTTTAFAWWCGTGRMTGGGKLVSLVSDTEELDVTSPTTNGYELHCDGSLPNNLEINSHDPNGFHFHLEDLQTANCHTTSPDGEKPPTAGFDTFEGVGAGRWSNGNDQIEACAEWVFIDGSQGKGSTNTSYIRITDAPPLSDTDICTLGGTAVGKCPGNTVLLVPTQTPLDGNNQAHK